MSARTDLVDILKKKFTALRGGRYYVTRRPVNWAIFDFVTHPFGVSILFDEMAFLRPSNPTIISIEMYTRMPDEPGVGEPEIRDDIMEELVVDVTTVLESLEAERNPKDSAIPLINKLDRTKDKIIQTSDVELKVQGIIASVFVEIG